MKLRSFWHFSKVTFFIADYGLLWGAVVCALKMSPRYPWEVLDGIWLMPELRFIGYGLPLFMVLGLHLSGIQATQAGVRLAEALTRTIFGAAGGMLVFLVLHALVEFEIVGRYILIYTLLYSTAFILGFRLWVWKLADSNRRNVILYGGADAYHDVEIAVEEMKLPIRMVGHTRINVPSATEGLLAVGDRGLSGLAQQFGISEVVVEVPDSLKKEEREALLDCTGSGINVSGLGSFYEQNFERVYVSGLRESWFWSYDPKQTHPVYFAFKRFMDISLSVGGAFMILPFLPLIALAIKLQDGGPIIYSQVRMGLYNQPFKIYKFRTMRVDAERTGAQWAKAGDVRVTFLGQFLRKTRIDEVPQFWNILVGDMSFIGPRPERPEFVDLIEKTVPYYRYRHLIKPGLSGWAQINYRYGASVEDSAKKLSYDLFYMKHASSRMDLMIALRTIVAMIKGAR